MKPANEGLFWIAFVVHGGLQVAKKIVPYALAPLDSMNDRIIA